MFSSHVNLHFEPALSLKLYQQQKIPLCDDLSTLGRFILQMAALSARGDTYCLLPVLLLQGRSAAARVLVFSVRYYCAAAVRDAAETPVYELRSN